MTRVEFESAWPEVSPRVARALRRRGVRAEVIEDVVQEAALRAVAQQITFRDQDHLLRWLHTVAWRLSIDVHRRESHETRGEVPDRRSSEDVAIIVECRRTLEAVRRCLPRLSLFDRQALLHDVGHAPPADRKVAVRLAVRRHRARRHLRQIMLAESAAVVFADTWR